MSVVNKLPSKIVDVDRIAGGIENSLGGREWKKNQVIHVFIIHKWDPWEFMEVDIMWKIVEESIDVSISLDTSENYSFG